MSKPIAYSRQTQNIVQVFYMLGAIWLVSIAVASPIVLGKFMPKKKKRDKRRKTNTPI